MRRGFTLLELLIVIIIVGVMATLGLSQYSQVVERSRGAEARQILGQLRSVCAAIYMEENSNVRCLQTNGAALGLGAASDGRIPNANCALSHYFRYTVVGDNGTNGILLTATRCQGGGKLPDVPLPARTLSLAANFNTGRGDWASPNGY
jgi:prepilin-type N-terminal cleavage/methylation domain-containing protein